MKNVTLADIAAFAKVSPAAVSYYFSGKKRLSPGVAQRIQAGARTLGYKPLHTNAEVPRHARPRIINMCVAAENSDIGSDIYMLGMMNGIMNCLSERGYQLMVSRLVLNNAESFARFRDCLTMVSGVILCNPWKGHGLDEELRERDIPFVTLGASEHADSAFYVDNDIIGAGYQAAEFLLAKGHRRIFFFNMNESMLQSQHRLEGFTLAYSRRGLEFPMEHHVYAPVSADFCYRAAVDLFSRGRGITAVVTSNELQAQGVIRAARELRVDIPKQLALMSMGGSILRTLTIPALTSIDLSSVRLGFEAARLIIDIIDKTRITPFHFILPGNVVEGDSA